MGTVADDARFDVLVIGAGPGGEGAAMRATKGGARVAIVDRLRQVGGRCAHSTTIPSKSLRHSVGALLDMRRSPLLGGLLEGVQFGFPQLLKNAESVIQRQVSMRREFYQRNHVVLVHGHARFTEPDAVEVELDGGRRRIFRADKFVLAPGSRPYHPEDVDFEHACIKDSDTILTLTQTPDVLTIYGAGVVGCEYACIFRNLGAKVNLINSRSQLLSFLDDEIVDALAYHLRDQGVLIRHNEEYSRVEADADGVTVHLKSGKKIRSDILLWAQGRTGNTDDLGLRALGLEADGRGLLEVDEFYRTRAPNVYAVGDVVGYPSLASASYDQGRFAAEHIVEGACNVRLVRNIPTGIYTSPEISSLGRTERELTAEGVPYEVGHAQFRSLARAQITGQTVGVLKILFHRETLEILGIHCFGDQASEIIHIGQAIMSNSGEGNTIRYFTNTTFNYPTMAEAYRVAALNGLNRLY
ncbi:MAG: Si-specific NAD(P)(+) transhydrogenase [Deltaproteobacteria bacterium]|nr:Si-specific NAD(P)(+) transhydrogenase [Deltaproteobacteria bacterium]